MTARQFKAALERNGFKHEYWCWYVDTTGQVPDVKFGGVFYRGGKCARRATIAYLIQRRNEQLKQREAKR